MMTVSGINKGSAVFLHLVRELAVPEKERRVAFFHSNTSEARKEAILRDLQLPLGSQDKRLVCVVATVSLGNTSMNTHPRKQFIFVGVGVDIRVDHAVIFGLSETAENLLQEGGRPMRGSCQETAGKHGYAFIFHKGVLGKLIYAAMLVQKDIRPLLISIRNRLCFQNPNSISKPLNCFGFDTNVTYTTISNNLIKGSHKKILPNFGHCLDFREVILSPKFGKLG